MMAKFEDDSNNVVMTTEDPCNNVVMIVNCSYVDWCGSLCEANVGGSRNTP